MAKSAADVQNEIFADIENPEKKIMLRVQKKEIARESYLEGIRNRCFSEGLSEEETEGIVYLVDKSLWGFGILDAFINVDDTISDVRLIDENNVRIKRLGKREATDIKFSSYGEYKRYIEFITNRNHTTMSVANAAQVFTDKDSSPTNILRFSLVSDLVNTSGKPTLLIRKIPKSKKTLDTLLAEKYLTFDQKEYLVERWKNGHGMLICGPNGSGKTTLTNALLEETPHTRSVFIGQESEELFCNTHPEMIFRKVIPERRNGNVFYDLKSLAKIALMESFDVMVIGEIKGGEAADLAYATYTGSQAMTTVHSVSARDGYEKIIDYALEEHPERSRGHYAKQLKTLDTVIFVDNYRIREIVELAGYDPVSETYNFRDTGLCKVVEA